jgi:hypothetical protein
MTTIASATFTVEPTEADGRNWINELLVTDTGTQHQYRYLADLQQVDPQTVLDTRVAAVNAAYAAKDAAAGIVGTVSIPLSKTEFINLFTSTEWAGYLAFIDGLNTNGALDAATKAAIKVGHFKFLQASHISKSDADTVAMLNLMVAVGILTAQRVTEVLGG